MHIKNSFSYSIGKASPLLPSVLVPKSKVNYTKKMTRKNIKLPIITLPKVTKKFKNINDIASKSHIKKKYPNKGKTPLKQAKVNSIVIPQSIPIPQTPLIIKKFESLSLQSKPIRNSSAINHTGINELHQQLYKLRSITKYRTSAPAESLIIDKKYKKTSLPNLSIVTSSLQKKKMSNFDKSEISSVENFSKTNFRKTAQFPIQDVSDMITKLQQMMKMEIKSKNFYKVINFINKQQELAQPELYFELAKIISKNNSGIFTDFEKKFLIKALDITSGLSFNELNKLLVKRYRYSKTWADDLLFRIIFHIFKFLPQIQPQSFIKISDERLKFAVDIILKYTQNKPLLRAQIKYFFANMPIIDDLILINSDMQLTENDIKLIRTI